MQPHFGKTPAKESLMKKSHVFSYFAVVAVIFLGCELASHPSGGDAGLAIAAMGKGATQQKFPISLTVNDCEGRPISVSGRLHVVTRVEQDGQDRYHVMLHGNFQGLMGTDSAGDTLTGGGTEQVVDIFTELPQTIVDTVRFTLVSADSTDTLQVVSVAQYIVDADGMVTATYSTPTAVCDSATGTGGTGGTDTTSTAASEIDADAGGPGAKVMESLFSIVRDPARGRKPTAKA
jgi:hypothetical protein